VLRLSNQLQVVDESAGQVTHDRADVLRRIRTRDQKLIDSFVRDEFKLNVTRPALLWTIHVSKPIVSQERQAAWTRVGVGFDAAIFRLSVDRLERSEE
jgi:hypothetical protein